MKENKSAARTIDLLVLIQSRNSSLTLTEICDGLSIPKSSAFELVQTLTNKGFLEVEDERLKTYKLGLKLYQVGVSYLTGSDLHRIARPIMAELAEQTGTTAFLAMEDKGELVYLDQAEPSTSVRTATKLGSRAPMHTTGLGKALLAAYSEQEVLRITGGGDLSGQTAYSITGYSQLEADIELTRSRGYAVDLRESDIDIAGVSSAVYDWKHNAIAALGVATLHSQMDDERIDALGKRVSEEALRISRKLGYVGTRLYEIYKDDKLV
ncbi:IclR family transcriptional regulator [Paenibacillus thalictri]|uniref:IclR family transcriptional regulator n=1 Tax=Paenibacillus thalictri TaxID=2527873 RepID=A0A4Q9DNV1_9BACL|nr:IclR family transcriptional regulator [Paenibacillus thalictri]TBL75732.1 IclR family transcriptional regulator [Paenibacillus thalictri]